MKRNTLLILLGLLLYIPGRSQFVLEHTYTGAAYNIVSHTPSSLYMINLEADGMKYVQIDRADKILSFYDLSHVLWKTISFAGCTDMDSNYNEQDIVYISQHLFDNDDEIEFMCVDQLYGNGVTQIVNEDNSILFTANAQAPFVRLNVPEQQFPIYNTPNGTKMILSGTGTDLNAYVYGLEGILSAELIPRLNDPLKLSAPYPNPATSTTRIDYHLPEGVSIGEIVFYDLQGNMVKSMQVDRNFDHIVLSGSELAAGTYYYRLQTKQGVSDGKKLVTIH